MLRKLFFGEALTILLLTACMQQPKEHSSFISEMPKTIPIQGYLVPKDSITEALRITSGKPVIYPSVISQVVQARNNLHPLSSPKIVAIGKPHPAFLGTGLYATPKIVKAKGHAVACIRQQSLPAQRPRFKDDACYNIQYLDVDQGLPNSYVTLLFEDRSSNIWFHGNNGLFKYNGKSFTNFSINKELANCKIYSILEDRDSTMWFGTDKGLCKYDGTFITHYDEAGGLPGNSVQNILQDRNGDLWIGTAGGLCKFDGTSFTKYTQDQGLPDNNVKCSLQDKAGNIWFSTAKGISIFNGKSFASFSKEEGMISPDINTMAEGKNGNIWMGTREGVYEYDGNVFKYYTVNEGLASNDTRTMIADRAGNIWLGYWRGGLSKFDGKKFTHYTEKEGLSLNSIWCITEDKEGNIWMGTDGGGINIFSVKSFSHLTGKEGLNNIVMAASEDLNGDLWIGTYDGGICKYDGKSFNYYTTKIKFTMTGGTMLRDKKGNMWFGSDQAGLTKYDGKNFYNYTEREGLSCNRVCCLFEDKEGAIWIGTGGGGVSKFDGNSFTSYTQKQGLSSDFIWDITQDKNGNLWFATSNGVNKFDGRLRLTSESWTGGRFTQFTQKEGLNNNEVRNIEEDQNGNLWFGTIGGGISRFDGKYLTTFTDADGLSNNIIRSIVKDKPENLPKGMCGLWLSTDKGIDHLIVENCNTSDTSGKPKVKIVVYRSEDGLKGEDFCTNSAFQDSKNRIWWGSIKSLTMLDGSAVRYENSIPTVKLDNIYLEQQFIDFNSLSDSIEKNKPFYIGEKKRVDLSRIEFTSVPAFCNYPQNLKLPYDINNVTFNFSAIEWSTQHKIKYLYILEGADKEWNPVTTEGKAVYTSLGEGTYKFKIKVKGFSDSWSEPFEFSFIIHSPWWKTVWAYFIYILICIAGAVLIFKWRVAALRSRQKELEQTIIERTADVVQEKKIVEVQKHLIEEKHKEITDSINYAERIQRSFLATTELLDENLKDYFVFFQPKDVVSGDFYWASKLGNGSFALITADSTGHGVPGAIMSILNISSLEKAVEQGWYNPSEILSHTRKTIIERLQKDGSAEGGKDGMDASLICFEFASQKFSYSAANNPIWVIRENNLIELKPDKMPVGKHDKDQIPFTQHEFILQKGDVIYTITDGFSDQFGGPKGKKIMAKQLKEFLIFISLLPMQEQKLKLNDVFDNWKGNLEQVDDVTIIGIRV